MAKTVEKSEKEKVLKDIQKLSPVDRMEVVRKALKGRELEDFLDNLAIEEAEKSGPGRPFEEYLAEWEAKHGKRLRRPSTQ